MVGGGGRGVDGPRGTRPLPRICWAPPRLVTPDSTLQGTGPFDPSATSSRHRRFLQAPKNTEANPPARDTARRGEARVCPAWSIEPDNLWTMPNMSGADGGGAGDGGGGRGGAVGVVRTRSCRVEAGGSRPDGAQPKRGSGSVPPGPSTPTTSPRPPPPLQSRKASPGREPESLRVQRPRLGGGRT